MSDEATARIKAVAAVHYLHYGDDLAMSALADDVVFHGRPGVPPTLGVLKQRHERFLAAMSDVRTVIHRQVAEGDLVTTHWTLDAVHSGSFMGHAATGLPITMNSMCIDRVVGDRVVEHWGVRDLLNVLRQIGAAPRFDPPIRL